MPQSFLNWKIELIIYFKNIQNKFFRKFLLKWPLCGGGGGLKRFKIRKEFRSFQI